VSALSRRRLLGGALVVAFSMSGRAFAQEGKLPGNLAKSPLLDSWIRVNANGRVTVFTGKAELGQGLKTALIQVAADELAVAASSLHIAAKPDVPRRKARTLIGHDLPRVDIPAKVSGGPAYLQDLRTPGMLHARVVRGPSDGTRLKEADIAAVSDMEGVVEVV